VSDVDGLKVYTSKIAKIKNKISKQSEKLTKNKKSVTNKPGHQNPRKNGNF
jgi:hypothetical protein